MPDIGIPELLIILVIALIIFGPGRLSGTGAAVGRAIREFRRGLQGEGTESKPQESDPAVAASTDTQENPVSPQTLDRS
jgi:sec-independent protein translocase protein TatA